MKNVGIIRRVDALGRIVIPREYRKLNKIEIGDPLEITASDSGEIHLKKVDLTAELITCGTRVADIAHASLSRAVYVCDEREFLCESGASKATLVGTQVSKRLREIIESRKGTELSASEFFEASPFVAYVAPICGDIDCFGAIIVIGEYLTDADKKVASSLATMVGDVMQKY